MSHWYGEEALPSHGRTHAVVFLPVWGARVSTVAELLKTRRAAAASGKPSDQWQPSKRTATMLARLAGHRAVVRRLSSLQNPEGESPLQLRCSSHCRSESFARELSNAQEAKQREVDAKQLRNTHAAQRATLRQTREQLEQRMEAMLEAGRADRALLMPEGSDTQPSALHARMAKWDERAPKPNLQVGQWKRAFKVRVSTLLEKGAAG